MVKRLEQELAASQLETSVIRSIRRITRAIDIYSKRLNAECALTGPQLAVLAQLDDAGPATPSDLAAAVSLSPPTVSGILDRLEARELLMRERQLDDKRRVLVKLTRAGRNALRNAPPPLQEKFSRHFRGLSAHKQNTIERALREVVCMLEAEDIDAAPMLVPAPEPLRPARH